uniref:Uncharacterized protein n=1 Tax=Ascaris lumbricoides TaxID=6252 RepID=A0A0M3IVA8_ASCLU
MKEIHLKNFMRFSNKNIFLLQKVFQSSHRMIFVYYSLDNFVDIN